MIENVLLVIVGAIIGVVLAAPVLPYKCDELTKLAEQVVRSQTTLTGVQAK